MRSGDEVREIFNLKYNNINSGASPGINDYEISKYLTEAQEEIIDEHYKGGPSTDNDSFDKTERIRKQLSKLVQQRVVSYPGVLVNNPSMPITKKYKVLRVSHTRRSIIDGGVPKDYRLVWRVLYETFQVTNEKECYLPSELEVIPLRWDEIKRLRDNPFKGVPSNRVLRLDNYDAHELLVPNFVETGKYIYTILKCPLPWIISDLSITETMYGLTPGHLTINGLRAERRCEFDNDVEDIIIDRAIDLATRDYLTNSLKMQSLINNRREQNR